MSITATEPARVSTGPAGSSPVRRPARPTRRWWRELTAAACWGTTLVVLYLWISGHGLQALLSSPAEALTSAGRLSGLIAADLLLIQVALMARIPWVERSYGQDELARRHRLVGFWSLNLLLAHIGLVTFGYALSDHHNVFVEGWDILVDYPGMLMAGVATACLVLVAVTSIRLARRKLRYESWHLLHLYAYLGVGLSIPHQLWTGADFTASPLARIYWWGSYALVAGAVVLFRVALPIWRTTRHRLTVAAVTQESADVVTVTMTGRAVHRLPARPGQFFIWRFRDGPGWTHGHPFSLSAAPTGNALQITVKDLGASSRRLAALRPGTPVLIEGPYGTLTGEHRRTKKVAMLACGIGVTPLRALLEQLPFAPGDATLVYRIRSHDEVIFRAELEQLAATRGITIIYLTGPRIDTRESWLPRSAAHWSDAQALTHLLPDLLRTDVFLCGPDAWMDAVATATHDAGLPAEQLHQERFTW